MAYEQLQLDALGDATRRAVFESLRQRPMSVTELAAKLPVSRPAVSQHLAMLRRARLVSMRKEGTRNYYGIDPHGLAALRDYFERFWDDALAAFKAEAEDR